MGLALGMACGILIFTLVTYHLSFDTFHKNPDRIYRFVTEWHDDEIDRSSSVPMPVGTAFRTDFSLGQITARTFLMGNSLVTINQGNDVKKFREENGVTFAEPGFLDIFNFPLIKGNSKELFGKPKQAVVTEKVAFKFFGTTDVIGKVIKVENKTQFTIVGVLKNIPANTDLNTEIYVSYGSLIDYDAFGNDKNWGGVMSSSKAYTLLQPGVTRAAADMALAQLPKKHFTGRDASVWKFKLQPLSDVHFNTEFDAYASKTYLWALFFIGLFLIITACVNFVNLATAQALNRAKEVGIRKVMGSLPYQLFWQFIAETAIITLVGVIVAVGLAELFLPMLNGLFKTEMDFHWMQLSLFIVFATVVVIFLSGSYPGLVLARFQPILALKSKLSQKDVGGFSLRRVLVVTQFVISQVLIIGSIVVVAQMRYAQTADLGFKKDAIVLLPMPKNDKATVGTMRNQLSGIPGVESVTFCMGAPASRSNSTTGINYDNRAEDEHWGINMKSADDQYISTFNIKLVAGRNVFAADTVREFLVNETVARKLGIQPKDLIGKKIAVNGGTIKGPVVGVVKDFYNHSFHSEIAPICIMTQSDNYYTAAVKMDMRHAKESLAAFEKIWSSTFPEELYSYQFLDESIARFYELDNTLLKLVEAFAAIAIIISCLGLYGLVSFMAVPKTKEIGVRKVLGANIGQVLWLFGKEFTYLLLIAFVIAAPLAGWAMHNYLQDFKYKISLGPGIFLAAIASTFVIAAITVSYRATIAALTNPVKSLRSE
ncbi:ABC transporter permease [Mucilaginibacter myungsuensis]|nr:ABC transporter permease [Mucilaginibacter myungsuensis]MDN3600647.1 ABC transporter permease [Mucilaginibacter myungsuensis]